MKIGLEISALFNTKGITGIPRVCMKLAEHAPVPLVFLAGDRVVPREIAQQLFVKPGGSEQLARWVNDAPYSFADGLSLDHVVYPLWRIPRRLAAIETTIVMDMTPISHPQYHKETGMAVLFERHILAPMPYNDRLVCISRATREALIAWDPALAERSVVAHLGQDWHFDAPATPATPRQYLCVGSVEPRKNLRLVVRWFLRSETVGPLDELRVIGGDGWGVDWAELLRAEAAEAPHAARVERIQRLGYVSDAELSKAYRSAYCLIYPSHFEGFGLPPLEAMAHGCPVLMSDRGSLPEVGGNVALYIRDVDAWTEIEERIVELSSSRERVAMQSIARAKLFQWQKFAKTVFQL